MNTKNILLSLASAAVGYVAATFITSHMNTLPPIEYQNGFSFNTPCPEHGTDTNVVTGNRLLRAYEISVDGEIRGEVVAEQITEIIDVMKTLGVPQPDEKSR